MGIGSGDAIARKRAFICRAISLGPLATSAIRSNVRFSQKRSFGLANLGGNQGPLSAEAVSKEP